MIEKFEHGALLFGQPRERCADPFTNLCLSFGLVRFVHFSSRARDLPARARIGQ